MALKQIKNKIVSTKKTGKVTKAMESVSAVKMRKSQLRAFESRPYVRAAMRVLSRLSLSRDIREHALSEVRDVAKKLVIIVTSDKGLAGSVNSAVLKQVEQLRKDGVNFDVIAIGRKAVEFSQRENLKLVAEYQNISDGVEIHDVETMTQSVIEAFSASKEYGSVEIVYQNFISTFEQKPTKRQVLPLNPEEVKEIMLGIRPKAGKYSDEDEKTESTAQYEIEPNPTAVFDVLIPQLVQILIFHSLLESKASEHSARMVAMKNATDKSKEVARALTLVYNKARQAAITAEVAEITGGMEAMKK